MPRDQITLIKEKLLRVVAPHYVAGAVWQNDGTGWRCINAAPIIKWMIGKDPQAVANYFNGKKKGYSYSWH